jgi:7,8-dihydropterin-6-yl-methyl-4-(beta-D-ribofuranosyl)aminobenzene 5'-phosphate synthase
MHTKQPVLLKEVDTVEIISLVDNSIDFISATENKHAQTFGQWTRERYGPEWQNTHRQLPIAEHGFSMLIKVRSGEKSRTVLFDTGGSPEVISENIKRMGLNLNEVDCIVLSHGHYDHFGGLTSAVKLIDKDNLPIIVHEDMFKIRGTVSPHGNLKKYIEFPTQKQLNAQFVYTKQPCLIADDMVCVTGEIPRKTSFESGFANHKCLVGGSWQPDPLILDDRAIVINVKGQGLVVVSGCAHAGIINTINYAREITGIAEVYVVMGGFHLAGKDCGAKIEATLQELLRINPRLVVPSHCTGWRAICAVAGAFGAGFVWNSVGHCYRL